MQNTIDKSKTNDKSKTKIEKEIQDARISIKWMPFLTAAALVMIVMQVFSLAKHPGIESLLRFTGPVGITLCCLSYWRRASLVLTGGKKTWEQATQLMGLLITVAGPSLGDMYHHKQMALLTMLGSATLAIVVFCLGMLLWELVDVWRASQKKRAFSMPPTFSMLPSLDDQGCEFPKASEDMVRKNSLNDGSAS